MTQGGYNEMTEGPEGQLERRSMVERNMAESSVMRIRRQTNYDCAPLGIYTT
jgi:hypothetical protein